MIVGFMYKHVSRNDNFMFFISYTLTSSISHSNLESMMGQLPAIIAQYLRQDYVVTSIVADYNFYMRHRSHDDLDVQELICQYLLIKI